MNNTQHDAASTEVALSELDIDQLAVALGGLIGLEPGGKLTLSDLAVWGALYNVACKTGGAPHKTLSVSLMTAVISKHLNVDPGKLQTTVGLLSCKGFPIGISGHR